MEKYDYRRAIIDDVKDYINSHPEELPDPKQYDDIVEYWYNMLLDEDSITGSGFSWYSTEENCAKYISNNMDLVRRAIAEYDYAELALEIVDYFTDHEICRYFDSTVRHLLLYECVEEALRELNS